MGDRLTEGGPSSLPARLLQARLAASLSTREVAERLRLSHPISHATVANYEKGRSSPSLPVLSALAGLYGKPTTWFLRDGPELVGMRYRCRKSKLRLGEKKAFEANVTRWIEAYCRLEEWAKEPLVRQAKFSAAPGTSGADLAVQMRKYLGFEDPDPIPSVVQVLEHFGIRVIELPTDLPIDGMAAVYGDRLAIVLNPLVSNDRCRLNAGHELLHAEVGDCHAAGPEDRDMEKRAFEFASHFLLPDSQLKEAFRGQSMVRLVQFKERFGISLSGMIYRAHESGIISDRDYKWLLIEFSKRGWRTKEPGRVRPDRATRFEQILDGAVGSKDLSWAEAVQITGVREEELRERLRLALGEVEPLEEGGEGDSEDVLKFPQ